VDRATPDGVVIRVHAQPGAARSRIAGTHGAALKIQVHARPVEGAANRAIAEVWPRLSTCDPPAVSVVAGRARREKRLAVDGLDVATACARLAPFVDKGGTPD
jgi:uncharacterized protein (TIGR00251 family)